MSKFNITPEFAEKLGAYLEGKLDSYEMENISKMLQDNLTLRTISEEVMFSIPDFNDNDLLNIEKSNNIAAISETENETPISKESSLIEPFEDNLHNNDYEPIEDNDSTDDSLFDDSIFELPEIPFLL